jgi:GT2 family glycosyltransferase
VIRGEDFNYNKSINKGLEAVQYDWVVISNNDVGYEKNWFTEIMNIRNKRPDIDSFSPKDPMLYMKYFDWHFIESEDDYFESYKVSEALMGWSLVINKTYLDKITPFDEQFDMYYQDNDYAEVLKTNGIKHALVRNSIACHLGTLNIGEERLNQKKKDKISEGYLKFAKKWGIWK